MNATVTALQRCSLWDCKKPLTNHIITVTKDVKFDDGFSRVMNAKFCSDLCASQFMCPDKEIA